jgi:hypothetical protein
MDLTYRLHGRSEWRTGYCALVIEREELGLGLAETAHMVGELQAMRVAVDCKVKNGEKLTKKTSQY